MKKRMIYLMNVDWNWIKQRPHFIAEKLQDDYDITIVNQYRYTRKGLQNRAYKKNVYNLKVIPRIDRYWQLGWLNTIIKKVKIRKLIKILQPEYIYITDPEQIGWLDEGFDGKIIYDCMDDHFGLARDSYRRKRVLDCEITLLKRADYIFISSQYLRETLLQRYKYNFAEKAVILRNGFDGKIEVVENGFKKNPKEKFRLCYFGTIFDWFDFELLQKSINDFPDIEYMLIGPVRQGMEIPKCDQIKYLGTVEHDLLYETTRSADCFIMPFIVDESIKAVDPVKLYEYINFNKNIICVSYEEVCRFDKYVYLYNGYDEYKRILENLIENNSLKYSMEERIAFLRENDWDSRINLLKSCLN